MTRVPHNLEILTADNPDKEDLKTFERDLLEHSVPATTEIKELIAKTAAVLRDLDKDTGSDDPTYNPRYGILGWLPMLATSKSGTLLLRRDQGEMTVSWDSRSRRL